MLPVIYMEGAREENGSAHDPGERCKRGAEGLRNPPGEAVEDPEKGWLAALPAAGKCDLLGEIYGYRGLLSGIRRLQPPDDSGIRRKRWPEKTYLSPWNPMGKTEMSQMPKWIWSGAGRPSAIWGKRLSGGASGLPSMRLHLRAGRAGAGKGPYGRAQPGG